MLIYMFKWNAFVFSFTFTTITFHPKYGLLLLKKYRFRSVMLNDCKSKGVIYGPLYGGFPYKGHIQFQRLKLLKNVH